MRLRDVGRFACRAPVLFMKKSARSKTNRALYKFVGLPVPTKKFGRGLLFNLAGLWLDLSGVTTGLPFP